METRALLLKSKQFNSFFLRMSIVVFIIVTSALISNAYGQCPLVGNNLVCTGTANNTYTTTSGYSSYVWTVSAGGTITSGGSSTDNTVTVTWNMAGFQSVSVSSSGCSLGTYSVIVIPLPTPTISGSNDLCVGSTGILYTTDSGMSNYIWSISAGGTITGGNGTDQITVNWNLSGPQTVYVNYKNAFGCSAGSPSAYDVTVNPLPAPTITGPASACVNSTGNIYYTEGGMSLYSWTISAGGNITSGIGTNSITVTWTATGPQTVSVNYTNEFGCSIASPTVKNVTVNPLPTPTLSGSASVCAGSTGNVYTTDGGMTNYTWTVSAGGTITAGGGTANNTVTVTWNTAGAQSVTVNYSNGNGCRAASPTSKGVTVNALPTPSFTSGPASVCAGSTGNVYTTQGGMTNYIWNVSAGGTITAGGTATSSSVTVTWNTAGAQTVSVNYTNGSGCTAASPTVYNVTVNALPVPTIAGNNVVCVGSVGVVYTTQAGNTNYIWNVSSGGTITAGGTATSSTVTVTWNTSGAQTVSVNYTNGSGCTAASPTVYNVTVSPLPVPVIAGPNPACISIPGNVYTTQVGMSNYIWTVSAGGTITAGGGTANSSVTVTWNTLGAQSVSVKYTNSSGCTDASPTVYNVTVNSLPTPTISGSTVICAGSTGYVYTTQAGMTNYVWGVTAGGSIAGGGTATDNTVTINWNTAGAQSVSVNYTNGGGCSAIAPTVYPVTVNPLPVPLLSGNTTACAGSTGNVYTTDAGKTNYTWFISAGGTITAGGTATNNTVTVTWNSSGSQSVGVNYQNSFGCYASSPTSLSVTVNAQPTPTIAGPALVCAGAAGNVYTTQGGMTNYIWSVSAGGNITAGGGVANNTVTVTWNTPGAQTVSVNYTNGNGCNAASPTVKNVTVNALPVPTITGPTPVCQNVTGNVYITETGMSNYIWSVSAGGNITAGGGVANSTVTVTWNTAGSQTVSVNYTNANGCTAAAPVIYPVTVNPLPVAIPIPASQTICSGNLITDITLTANIPGNDAITNGGFETGSLAPWVVLSASPLPAVTNTAAHTGTYSVFLGSPGSYGSETPGDASIYQTISVPATGGTLSYWYLPNTTDDIDYDWQDAYITDNSGTILATIMHVCENGGWTNITYDMAAFAGQTVRVEFLVHGDNSGDPTCMWVDDISMIGYTAPTFTWTRDNTVSVTGIAASGSGTITGTLTNTTASPVTVTFTITPFENGCAGAPVISTVLVNTLPVPSIAGPTPVCAGVTGNVYTTQAGMSNYIWSVSSGGTITGGGGGADNTVTVTWNTAGAQTVSVNYDDANGCTAASPTVKNVTVNASPTPTISGPSPVCAGTAGNVYTTEAGMSNYTWSVSAGGTISAGGGAANNTVTVTWNTYGVRSVSVSYTNGGGCSSATPTIYPVIVYELPTANVVPVSQTICSGNPISTISLSYTYTGFDEITNGGFETGNLTPWIVLSSNPAPVISNTVSHSGTYSVFLGSPSVFGSETPGDASIYQTIPIPSGGGTLSYWYLPSTMDGIDFDWQDAYITNTSGTILATIMHVCQTSGWTHVTYDMSAFAGQTVRVEFLVHGDNAGDPTNMYVDDVTMVGTPGPTFTWVRNNFGTVTGIPNSGSGPINGTLTNTIAIPVTVTFFLTPSDNGCTGATIQSSVLVNPLPVPTIAGPTPVCAGSTGNVYTTQGSMTNYSWAVSAGGTITAGGTATSNTVTITWNATGTQTVSVNYTDGNGCTAASPTVKNVTVNALPTPTISGPTPVCAGSTGNVYTTQAGMTNYIWSVSAGGTITAGGGAANNTVTVTWNTAGAQTVSVNYTNGTGCTAAAPFVFNVTVNALPTPTIAGPTPVCVGIAGNVYTTQAGMTNYIWTVSGGGSITAGGTTSSNTVTITWNTAGAQTVSVNYTNGNGCTAAAPFVFNVTVNALPIPTIAGPTPVCVSSTGNVYTTQASMTNYIWSVSAGGSITAGGTATSNTVTVTWNTAGAQTVSVNYTNGNGCTAVSPTVYNVTVNPLPVPTISGPTPVCVNSAGNVYTTQGGMTNYIWSVSSGGTITAGGGAANNTVTVTWTSSGAKTVSVNYTNGNGCTAASPTIYNVTVNPLPVPTISGPASVCVNSTGNIYSTQPAMTNYIWAVSAGGTVTAGGTATDNTVTVTWNTVGAQSVSVNYTNANGCTAASPTVYPVTVNPLPAPTVSGPGLVCNLSTNNIYTTQGGMSGYTWTVTGGTITSGNGTASITVTWNVSGSQTVSVNYQNSFGCYSGTPGSMTVIVIPLPTPTITGPNDICAGSTGNVYTTESGMTNYTWTVSAGGTITAGGGLTDNTVTVTWNSAGAQTVTVTYLNAFGCAAATPTVYPVTVNPRAVPTISGPASVCLNSTGNVYTTESGNSNYIWSVSAGGTITAGGGAANNTVTITWIATGAQTVSVSYTNAFGCTTVTPTVYNVTVNALPTPSLSGPSPVCAGSTGNIYTTDAGQSNYLWTVSAGGTITAGGGTANNTATVTWNTVGSQSISVNYTNSNGCSAGLPTVKNVTVNALPIPTIAGPTPVCAGTTGNVYTTQGGNSNYIWSVSAGGTITAGGTTNSSTVTVTWNTAGAQTVSVNYTNGSSCTAAAPFVFNVTVNALPTPTIIGPSSVCATSTGNVYITETGMTNYVWSVSAGGTITAGGGAGNSFVAITWNTPGAQTVSVNYTNANGCTAAAPTVFNVTVNALPVPTISGPTPVCVISTGNVYTTQAGMTNYIWLVSAGGTITAGGTTNSNTVTVTWNITGAQTVSVNYTNSNGCTAAAPTVFNVTANPTPAPTLSGPTPVCAGTTGNVYTTQAGMTNYTWAVSAGGTITAGGTTNSSTVTVTWNTAGAQTVSVDYTNSSGCTAPSPTVFNVTVNALPTPTIAGPTPVCATSAGNVYTTQAGMTNYIWAVSAGGTITAGGTTNSNTVTVTWNTAGAQTVSVNYTNGAGCTAAAPFVYNVTVNALPVPTIAGPTPVCVTSTGNVYTTQGGMTNYLWSVSAGGTITAGGTTNSNSVTVTWNTVGAQTVSVNYTNSNGCTALSPTVFPVTVNALPVPTIAGPTPVCVTSTGNVYTTQAGMTNYIWSVSAGGTITAGGTTNSNTVTITWNTVGAQTVSVNYTNANGCTAAAPVVYNVTVNALPVPTIAGPTPVCVGIAGNVYTTQPGNTNYIWSVSAGGTITAGGTTNSNTITITWNTAGAQTVSVNYTNSNGCTAAAPFVYNVTVNALPVPTLAGPTPVCAGTAGNVYTTQAGMTNYIWAVSAGGTITAGGTTNSNTVTITWNTAGAQTVSVNYTNANGCTAVAPVVYNVTVNALPVPTIAGPASVCVNSTGNVYTTQAGMTNYLWTVSAGGTITAGGTTNSNTVTVTWTTVGAQTVRVNYTNANGCTAAAQTVYNVTVNALPVPTLAGPTPVCVGIAGNVYTTQAGMTNYIWAVSAGGTITAGGTTNSNTVTITWTTVGAQTVSVNYTNANGCTAVAPVVYNVTVNALPVPTLAGPTPICAGTTGNVYTTQAGMTNYIWAVSAGGTITAGGTTNSNTVTVTWNTAGAQTVSVNYTNANGCTAVAPVVYNVTVNPLPVVTIAGPTPVCATTTGNVYTTQAGMTNYIWAVSAGGTVTAGGTPTSNTVTITWNTAGAQTISVNYTNANGCTAAAPTVFNVTVNALPTPTITGPASVCINSTGNVYTTQAGNSNYVWSVSPGGIVTAGGGSASNTVTVTWITLGAQFVGVNYTNVNGCTAPVATTYNVTVNPLPVPTLTGPNPVCVGSTGNVYTTQAGMTNYIWAVSAGGTITAGGTSASNTVTVTWNTAGAQTVSVNYSNSFGCTAAAPIVYNVTVNGLPVPTITGPTPICVGTTGNVYTTQPGMTNYTWSVSAGGTITAGGGTASNTVTVTWNTAGAQTVSVNYTNAGGCTALAPVVYNVTVSAVPVPTLTGATSMCVNSGYYNYTTDPGMQNYVWTVSSGGVINYGSGTYQIQVSWIIGGAQTVSVTYTNGAGCIPAAPTVLNVTVNPVPDPAGAITGTATVCAGTNGVTYSVAPIPNATAYVWALPPNATIASGSGTNSITVNFATNATSGDIIVYGNNVCGNGPNSPPFAVTVNPLPGAAGTISGPADVCKGATGVVYSVASITNATGYSWTVPAGVTITSGNNSNTITCTFTPSAVSGNITVMGTNSCGDGTVSPNFAVTVNPIPPTPVVTNHGDTLISNIPNGNQWYFQGTMLSGATGQTYVATQEGYYWDIVTINGCSSDSSNHKLIRVTGIESHPASVINLYPVPNDGRFNIAITTVSEESFTIGVYNNLGVKIYETPKVIVNGSLIRVIDLRPAPNGMYTVIIMGDRETAIKKVIVNN